MYGYYLYSSLDINEILLRYVSPHLVTLRESTIFTVSVSSICQLQATYTHDTSAYHTMVSHEGHKQVIADTIAELW